MNNITQHTICPYAWKMGQCIPNGSVVTVTNSALSQFFPFILTSYHVFPIPSNWRDLYGRMYFNPGDTGHLITNNEFSSDIPFAIYDSVNPTEPSKFLSLILYK